LVRGIVILNSVSEISHSLSMHIDVATVHLKEVLLHF